MDYNLSSNYVSPRWSIPPFMASHNRLSVFIRNHSKLCSMHRRAALCMASAIIKHFCSCLTEANLQAPGGTPDSFLFLP